MSLLSKTIGPLSAVPASDLTVRIASDESKVAADRWDPALWQPTEQAAKQTTISDKKPVTDGIIRNPEELV